MTVTVRFSDSPSPLPSELIIDGRCVVKWSTTPGANARIIHIGIKTIFLAIRESERNIAHLKRFLDASDVKDAAHIMLDENMQPIHVDDFQCDRAVFGYIQGVSEEAELVASDAFRQMWPAIITRRKQLDRVLERADLADYENWDQKALTASESDVTDK